MSAMHDATAANDAGDAALTQDATDAELAPDGQIIRDSEMIPADEGRLTHKQEQNRSLKFLWILVLSRCVSAFLRLT